MQELSRRDFLAFLGAGATGAALGAPGLLLRPARAGRPDDAPRFTPVRLPHPLTIYTELASWLPSGPDGAGRTLPAAAQSELASYAVIDDVVVPPEYETYVILSWGDRVYANPHDYCGYNHDWTGFAALRGRLDGYLFVNHEYVSYPWEDAFAAVVGFTPESPREAAGEALYNVGGSLVRIRRTLQDPQYRVVGRDPANRRYHGLSGLAINADVDGVTRWGPRPHQEGDAAYFVGTGPAAREVFAAVDGDGLGNRIIGTQANCSGGMTPWNSFMSAEENFQSAVTEAVLPTGIQVGYLPDSVGARFGLAGEKYGWMVEIDPARMNDPAYRPKKHTALGRFRHENIALRACHGRRLVAYMGDDRRGGHTWKFVSHGCYDQYAGSANSALLEAGTLHVARYHADGTGEWIPIEPGTRTVPNVPSELTARQLALSGRIDRGGLVKLPRRAGLAGADADGGTIDVTVDNEAEVLAAYRGKRLADFYASLGAALVDCFPVGNLVGGTPTARPEDIEVHPHTNAVFIAYTDGVPGDDGYPDSRIFTVQKYTAAIDEAQPSGGLYKIIERSADGTGRSFRWERFVKGGEAGAEDGAGFANVDNLAFDRAGNLWGVTDMSTSHHNGFTTGADPGLRTIDHGGTEAADQLVGVFGNNWLFHVPSQGELAGQIVPFAYGPVRCELTGPTFIGDTLILSVQHPGEDMPITETAPATLTRSVELLTLRGEAVFEQQRTVPYTSQWPRRINGTTAGGVTTALPQPATIGIRRRDGQGLDFL